MGEPRKNAWAAYLAKRDPLQREILMVARLAAMENAQTHFEEAPVLIYVPVPAAMAALMCLMEQARVAASQGQSKSALAYTVAAGYMVEALEKAAKKEAPCPTKD